MQSSLFVIHTIYVRETLVVVGSPCARARMAKKSCDPKIQFLIKIGNANSKTSKTKKYF
jgi:hypothetical protein